MHAIKIAGPYITINSKTLINLCSNDYLGIRQPRILNKQNQSSSRLVAGNDNLFSILEKKLSKHSVKTETNTKDTIINISSFEKLVEKITKRNSVRPYPEINDMPN